MSFRGVEFQPEHRLTIGIDIGGTFTDLVVLDSLGRTVTAKAPTTPEDFSDGVLDAIAEAAGLMSLTVPGLLGRTDYIKHGSTVATNALITRRGVRVGLITTRGFEDTPLIMRAVGRVDGLSEEEIKHVGSVTKPEPLVAPHLIRGVRERIDSSGVVIAAINLGDVDTAIAELVDVEHVEALAVSFLNAWRNPVHEQVVQSAIEKRYGTKLFSTFGGELSQLAGEYARTNTAIANAFIGPTVHGYLANLDQKLRAAGFMGRLLVMQGNGGLAGREHATPISTLQSGPAGGLLASAYMAGRMGHHKLITTDMGGTSFDVGLIDNGYWRYADEPIFDRFRIVQPIAEITSIGAGGGTIARVDPATGRLLVGPQSAGARPGPICYGQGGSEPTVTDADVVLGYIDPDYFLGGRRRLDRDLATRAIEAKLARPLGMDVVEAAAAIATIVDNKMADLIRREVIRSGALPEEFVLYSFGGAGPLHAVGYARDLGIQAICVFPTSPVLSAFGVAMADLVHTRLATRLFELPGLSLDGLNGELGRLEATLMAELVGDGWEGEPEFRRFVTMRFRRQTTGEELPLPWTRVDPDKIGELETLFMQHYEELYGSGAAYRDAGIDISSIRVDAIGKVAKPEIKRQAHREQRGGVAEKGRRPAYFNGGFIDALVYDYDALAPGSGLIGPAIVESPFTTVVLPPGSTLMVDEYLNLVIQP